MPTDTVRSAAGDALLLQRLLDEHRLAVAQEAIGAAWLWLRAAHVVGQTRFLPHLRVHGLMLALAWHTGNRVEIRGQLLRLLLTPLGHLFRRLPLGNPGSSDVSAFQTMPPQPDVAAAIAQARRSL